MTVVASSGRNSSPELIESALRETRRILPRDFSQERYERTIDAIYASAGSGEAVP